MERSDAITLGILAHFKQLIHSAKYCPGVLPSALLNIDIKALVL
jgi:hypothetical protein